MKKTILRVLLISIIIISGIFAIILGYQYKERNYQLYDLLLKFALVLLILILTIFIVSTILSFRILKRKRLDMNKLKDEIAERRKLAEVDVAQYYAKLKSKIFIGDIYYVFISILVTIFYLLICFSAEPEAFILWIISAIPVYILLDQLIYSNIEIDPNYLIYEYEFNQLWEIIRSAANLLGIKKKIICSFDFNNMVFVREYSNKVYITFGIYVLQYCSEEELKGILLHEFAHVYNDDTLNTVKLDIKMKKWNLVTSEKINFISKYLFTPIADKLTKEYELYMLISSKMIETKAEELANSVADGKYFINALAKTELFEHFFNYEFYHIDEIYQGDKVPSNYFEIMYNHFLKYYQENKDEWERIISLRIPDTIDTHPTLTERMEIYQQSHFTVDFSERLPEIDRIVKIANKQFFRIHNQNFSNIQYNYHTKHVNIVNEYENNPDTIERFKLKEIASSYRVLGKPEEALNIYNKILEEKQNSAEIIYYKGTLLLSMGDNQGIDLIYQAISINDLFLIEGVPQIRMYCAKMGLKEELEKLKDFTEENRDYVVNVRMKDNITLNDKFAPTNLSQDDINDIVANVSQDPRITSIRIVDKKIDKENRLVVLGILVQPQEIDNMENIAARINDYLNNDRSESFYLLSLNHARAFIPIFSGVKGSIVYQK